MNEKMLLNPMKNQDISIFCKEFMHRTWNKLTKIKI